MLDLGLLEPLLSLPPILWSGMLVDHSMLYDFTNSLSCNIIAWIVLEDLFTKFYEFSQGEITLDWSEFVKLHK